MNDYEKEQSCIFQVTQREPFLTGTGVIVAVLDSGIDYFLPEFLDEKGQTRILAIWDQTAVPDTTKGLLPPPGYQEGVLYTREQINEALSLGREEGLKKVPVFDSSGHGTAVAGVAVGTTTGVAIKAQLLVVKLGNPDRNSFPRTTQLMRGIQYSVNVGVEQNKPVVVNISFGNTYGDHQGNSLLERFIDNVSEIGRTAIIIGSGNEGTSNGHTAGVVRTGKRTVELAVGNYETGLSIQLWTYYQDVFNLVIYSPGGEQMPLQIARLKQAHTERATLEQTQLLCYLGKPLPYNVQQEIFIDMIPTGSYLTQGIWRLELEPVSVVTGEYRFYLPSYAARTTGTGFFLPTPDMTITIPSTARRAVTVGAYNTTLGSYADFSGRGYVYRYSDGRTDTAGGQQIVADVKPDIVAPGVNITVPVPYGGYEQVSGTSFATPFVAGSAALMMEWGIVQGNDLFLYGEKVKAYLQRGAKPLRAQNEYPNVQLGWGALCLRDSLPV